MNNPLDLNALEAQVQRFGAWRAELIQAVGEYRDWLESTSQLTFEHSIRFHDLIESLKQGRLLLVFLAEYSRGKSELINALFFSDFKRRLLPSDIGRTTMCPTEIFHNPAEEPYLRLLPIDSRYRDSSILSLKFEPMAWTTVRLNLESPEAMREALDTLADTRQVPALEARMMGFLDELPEGAEAADAMVDVPRWRYALLNFPHPLLSKGLAVLDTPGLNALGLEPELTLNMVPNAQGVVFMLSVETGVTKSDLEVWRRYVKPSLVQRLAVLNKIDLMWDELKPQVDIDRSIARQVASVATTLDMPAAKVIPVSAQKALVGRVKGDHALVERSGIAALERMLADEIVPARREAVCRHVSEAIGGMIRASRDTLAQAVLSKSRTIVELQKLADKNESISETLLSRVRDERHAYNSALAEYKVNRKLLADQWQNVAGILAPERLEPMLAESRAIMGDAWTTAALARAMRKLIERMSHEFDAVLAGTTDLASSLRASYAALVDRFSFRPMDAPSLDLSRQRLMLTLLVHETDAFCRDPANIMVEARFMIRRFYDGVVSRARNIYDDARVGLVSWFEQSMMPVEGQIKSHRDELERRLESLEKIRGNAAELDRQLATLRAERNQLVRSASTVTRLAARLQNEVGVG